MAGTFVKLLELIRFSHTVFALPFAFLAAEMAWHLRAASSPPQGISPWEILGILLAMVTARSFAMAWNRLVDRDIDAANPRTASRHLPAGTLSVSTVRLFAASTAVGFLASTLLFLPNRLPLYLAPFVLLFLGGYSHAKRFTSLAHLWLGCALGMAPIAAWIALRGATILSDPSDIIPAVILGMSVVTWVTGFDIIYACQDAEFDRQAKLFNIAAKVGVSSALKIAAALHALTVALLFLLPLFFSPLGGIYLLGVVATGMLLIYEHGVVRPDDLSRVNLAFFKVNAVISLGLFAVATLDLMV